MAALKSVCSGEACHAFSGIGASIRNRYTFSPALVVPSPFGAFPASASRPLWVPRHFIVFTLVTNSHFVYAFATGAQSETLSRDRVPIASFDISSGD